MTLFYDDCKNFPQLLQYIRSRSPEEFLSQVALGYVVEASPIVKATLPLAKKYDAKPEEIAKLKEYSCYVSVSQEEAPMSVYDFTLHLLEHLDAYEKAFSLFQDDWSQLTFFHMILFRLLPYTGAHLDAMRTDSFLYFRKELLEESSSGVLVDVGAYLGVSPLQYVQSYGDSYQKLYLFEPNPVSMERCKERTAPLPNVVYSSVALSDQTGTGHFCFKDSFSHLHPTQGEHVTVDTLDRAVTEPITFLKVNVSGGELDVLQGAVRHLTQDKPNLSLSLSHVASHLFQIPLFLNEIHPNQTFYLRYHGLKDSTVGFVLYVKPSASAAPSASDLEGQLKAAIASLGGTAPVSASPVVPSPASTDLDAQLKAAMASLGGTAPVPASPVVPSPASTDLDAQLKAAIASLGGSAPVPASPVVPSPASTDLDAQLNAAIASLGGTAPVTASPVVPSPASTDLNAQLKAAIASLGGAAPVPPVSGVDAQLNAMKSKLESMSSTLEKVSGHSTQLEHGNFKVQSSTSGLSFSKIDKETPIVPSAPVSTLSPKEPPVPSFPSHPARGNRTQNALDLIETMTEGVVYLRATCESDSPEFHSIMESLQLSLDALSRNLGE